MTALNKELIEQNGFRVGNDGKVRNAQGHLIKAALAERIAQGNIMTGFDLENLRKRKARKAATGTSDLVSTLREISTDIEVLEVGMTAKVAMKEIKSDAKDKKRGFVMQLVTKINNLTYEGREWAGRNYDTKADPDAPIVYVTRLEDGTPRVRKTGGGRKAGTPNKAKTAANNLQKALEASKEHLESDNITPEMETGIMSDISEEAQVINH